MTDRASLACNAAAVYAADYVELLLSVCKSERLTNDELESLKAEVIVDVSVVDCDLTCTLIKSYAG